MQLQPQQLTKDGNMSFISIMKAIGNGIKIIFTDVVKFLPSAAQLAGILFPGEAGAIKEVVNSVDLIQQTVATVEQKFAAAGAPTGTGPQKLAQVLSIVTPVVQDSLAKAGIQADQTYITNIVNAVVAILNVSQAAPKFVELTNSK